MEVAWRASDEKGDEDTAKQMLMAVAQSAMHDWLGRPLR
jgi:hypothetical protein